jgi:hypothetical protein
MEKYLDYIKGKKKLLSGSNAKLSKDKTVEIYGLSLLPHTLGGGANLCSHATEACKAVCLVYTGNARFTKVNVARGNKTSFYLKYRNEFIETLNAEIKRVNAIGSIVPVAVRLNVFSDIAWEKQIDMNSYNNTVFYDYTKNPIRMDKYSKGVMPSNYHLTFSYSGDNLDDCIHFLDMGHNAAIVFRMSKGQSLPKTFKGYKVINGDESDYRPNDEKGVIVGLKYKQPVANKYKDDSVISEFYIDLRK